MGKFNLGGETRGANTSNGNGSRASGVGGYMPIENGIGSSMGGGMQFVPIERDPGSRE